MRALPGSHTRSTQWTDDSLESVHSNEWCTGEDSNLRTSQGGADLQSAGFNHSPTCAEMPVARLSTFPAANRQDCNLRFGGFVLAAKNPIERRERTTPLALNSPQLEKLPYGMPLETCHCRRAAQMPCVPEPMLELAKGFEPLTL